ncbi:MAG TPA: YihY family inner membrane protein [Moraxellaceae bacterium]|nr:YihY family inner membrane protein [Moraxellaceae bacterium]
MRHELAAGMRRGGEFARFVFRHFTHDTRNQHAVVLTYTTLFAVVPMMTVTFAILSSIPSMQAVSGQLQQFIFRHFIPSSGQAVQQHLAEFSAQASHLTVIGSAMLFITAIMMLVTIEKAFNEIWKVREGRKGLVGFLRYWAVLSLGPLLLGAAFALSSYMMSLQLFHSAAELVEHGIGVRLVTLLFTALGFTLLYVAVPNCKVPPRAALVGGIMAALLFEGAKHAFAIFISHFSSYTLVYGAFAAFPAFLLWIYLSWAIILLGVEITRALTLFGLRGRRYRHPVLALMEVLQLFWQRHREGGTVSHLEIMAVLGEQEEDAWLEFAPLLERLRLIRRTEGGNYVLARDLATLDFYAFHRALPWALPTPADLAALDDDTPWLRQLRPALLAAHERLGDTLQLPLARLFAGAATEEA